MTYFRERGLTIIGAGAFHGPVREGKGWFHSAMVARHKLVGALIHQRTWIGSERLFSQAEEEVRSFYLKLSLHLGLIPQTTCKVFKVIGSSLTGN